MKKGLMLLAMVAVVFASTSFVNRPVVEERFDVMAGYGDTVWDICEHHYDKNEVRCFDEFVYEVRKQNNLLGKNVLQAGQVITIVVKKQK